MKFWAVVANWLYGMLTISHGKSRCRDKEDVWNRGSNQCFRQYSSISMITSDDAKNHFNGLHSDLLIIDTKKRRIFMEDYYRGTDSLPALVGLSDRAVEGHWIWDNGVFINYLHWGLRGVDFHGVDIERPYVFCFNADCGWIGVYRDIFMVWDNCCSKTSHWLCAYTP